MNEKIIVGTGENFAEVSAKGIVLVDFWAAWCGPCKMLSPVLDEVAQDLADKVSVVKVNIDEQEELSEKYNILTVPTLMLMKDGIEVDRMVGYRQKQQVIEFAKSEQ